jgi:hypothetical protein
VGGGEAGSSRSVSKTRHLITAGHARGRRSAHAHCLRHPCGVQARAAARRGGVVGGAAAARRNARGGRLATRAAALPARRDACATCTPPLTHTRACVLRREYRKARRARRGARTATRRRPPRRT